MNERAAAMAEAYRRNIMNPEQKAAYEEAMRRGLVTLDRSMGERAGDNVGDGWRRSVAGYLSRKFDPGADGFSLMDIFGLHNRLPEGSWQDRLQDRVFGEDRQFMRSGMSEADRRERVRRTSYEARATADPVANLGDALAALGGQVVGAGGSPESYISPGRSIVGRALGSAGVNAVVDAGLQAGDTQSGVQDRYDPVQTVAAAAMGATFSLTGDVVLRPMADFVRRAFTDPPRVPPSAVPDPALPMVDPAAPSVTPGTPRTATSGPALTAAATPPAPPTPAVVLPDFDAVRPMPVNTFLARQGRSIDEKGLPRYVADVLGHRYTEAKAEAHPISVLTERMRKATETITGRPEDLLPSANPTTLVRGLNDVANTAQTDIVMGVHAYRSTAKPTGPALRDLVMASVARDRRGGGDVAVGQAALGKYAAARRALAEWTNFEKGTLANPPTRQSRADLEAFIARMDSERPELRELSDGLNTYAQDLLKKKLDAGLLERAVYDKALAARDYYTPLKRYAKLTDGGSGAITGKSSKGAVVKEYRGLTEKQAAAGNDEFVDPVQVLADETFRTAERIRINDLNRSLVNMATRLNGLLGSDTNGFIQKIKRPVVRTDSPTDQLDLFGEQEGTFRTGEINDAGRAVLHVWNNGKMESYELLDPEWGRMAFEAITSMTRRQSDLFVDTVAAITNVWRASVTKNPGFLFVNFVRDSLESWVLTDVVNPLSGVKGMAQQVARADDVRLYNLSAGIAGGELQAGRDGILRQKDTGELARAFDPSDPINSFKARYLNWRGVGRGTMDIFRVTELSEVGVRQGVFNNAMARAKKEGLSDHDALIEAALIARDYSDFGRYGSKTHAVVRMFAFLNTWSEGIDKLIRVTATDPASAVGRAYQFGGHEAALKAILAPLFRQDLAGLPVRKADKAALKLAVHAWTRIAAMGTFGLGLSAMFWDSPEYRDEDDRTRATHWVIPDFMGVNIKIPKPYGTAFLSNMMEGAYEAEHGNDPTAWGSMWEGVVDTFAPPVVAPALDTVTGLRTGVDPQTGRKIVPEHMDSLPPELQFTNWTSWFAKTTAAGLSAVGVDVSPAVVDYAFRSFGGTTGTDALNMMDATNPDRPAGRLSDWPVIRRFASPHFKGSQDKQDFFERAAANTSELQRARNGVREYLRIGNTRAAQDLLNRLDEPGRIYVASQQGEAQTDKLNPISRATAVGRETSRMIGELNGMAIRGETAQPLPEMTRQRRRMVVDALERLTVAEMGNAMIATRQPGFSQREMWDRNSIWRDLDLMAPQVAEELQARLRGGDNRAYDYDVVMDLWPQAETRIREQGFNADLTSLARQAKRRSAHRRREVDDPAVNSILMQLDDD